MAKIPWHFFKIPWQFPDLEKILFFPDFSLTRGTLLITKSEWFEAFESLGGLCNTWKPFRGLQWLFWANQFSMSVWVCGPITTKSNDVMSGLSTLHIPTPLLDVLLSNMLQIAWKQG